MNRNNEMILISHIENIDDNAGPTGYGWDVIKCYMLS